MPCVYIDGGKSWLCFVMVVVELLSHAWLFATPWTIGRQAPLSMGCSRQECQSGLPCRPPGDLSHTVAEPMSPSLAGDSLPLSYLTACLPAKSLESCPTLCDPVGCSRPGSSVRGILQGRTVKSVAYPFSRGSSQPRDRTQVSCTAGVFLTSWATREDQTGALGNLMKPMETSLP